MEFPPELQFKDVRKQQPIILAKEARNIVPSNRTTFSVSATGNSTQIVIRIPSEENYSVDLSGLHIVGEFTIGGLTSTNFTTANCNSFDDTGSPQQVIHTVGFCDSWESMVFRNRVLVNGSDLENIDHYAYAETILNPHLTSSGFCNGFGAGGMGMNLSQIDKHRLLLGGATADRTTSNTVPFSFPLRFLGLTGLNSILPNYLLGQSSIEIRIFLSSSNDFLYGGQVSSTTAAHLVYNTWTPFGTADSSKLTYTLTNVQVLYDSVQTAPEYNNALRSYLASNSMTFPISTLYTTTFDIPANTNNVNQTISTQLSDVESVIIAFVRNVEQTNNIQYANLDRIHKIPGLDEARILINSRPVPSIPIKFYNGGYESQGYTYLLKALMQGNGSLETIGNCNSNMLRTLSLFNMNSTSGAAPTAATVISVPVFSGSGLNYGRNKKPVQSYAAAYTIGGGYVNENIWDDDSWFWASPSTFAIGFNTSKSDYADQYTSGSGVNMQNSSGLIQIQLKFSTAVTEGYTAVVLVRHKRILEISSENEARIIY